MSIRIASRSAPLWALLISLVPEAGRACNVCTTGISDEASGAFMVATIFMTSMPFVAVGGLVLLLRRRYRALEAQRKARGGEPGQPRGATI